MVNIQFVHVRPMDPSWDIALSQLVTPTVRLWAPFFLIQNREAKRPLCPRSGSHTLEPPRQVWIYFSKSKITSHGSLSGSRVVDFGESKPPNPGFHHVSAIFRSQYGTIRGNLLFPNMYFFREQICNLGKSMSSMSMSDVCENSSKPPFFGLANSVIPPPEVAGESFSANNRRCVSFGINGPGDPSVSRKSPHLSF